MLLAACAAAPQDTVIPDPVTLSDDEVRRRFDARGAAAAPMIGSIELGIDGGLPHGQDQAAVFAGNLNLGGDTDPLRYRASFALEPGDLLVDRSAQQPATPTRFFVERTGQKLAMRLPALAGAPVSLGLAAESQKTWLIAGHNEVQRELADLRWSPAGISVSLQWAGPMAGIDPGLALDCGVRSSIRVPTAAAQAGHSQALRLAGQACRVSAAGADYVDLVADTWGLSYIWSGPQHESSFLISMIDPAWNPGTGYDDIAPGYELSLSHRHRHGPLSANALVAVRQAAGWHEAFLLDDSSDASGSAEIDLSANAALTWHLPAVSLSANWTHGADPLWFIANAGRPADRFALGLDLSRWASVLTPDLAPRLGFNWHWSQVRSGTDTVAGDSAFRLNMLLAW